MVKDQLTVIPIRGEQDPELSRRPGEDGGIVGSGRVFPGCGDVVASLAEPPGTRRRKVFVGQEPLHVMWCATAKRPGTARERIGRRRPRRRGEHPGSGGNTPPTLALPTTPRHTAPARIRRTVAFHGLLASRQGCSDPDGCIASNPPAASTPANRPRRVPAVQRSRPRRPAPLLGPCPPLPARRTHPRTVDAVESYPARMLPVPYCSVTYRRHGNSSRSASATRAKRPTPISERRRTAAKTRAVRNWAVARVSR